jgi:hypothetical protein
MDKVYHLRDQAERAERLARSINDTLTIERLLSFAAECHRQLELVAPAQHKEAR